MKWVLIFVCAIACSGPRVPSPSPPPPPPTGGARAAHVRITTLSTMMSDWPATKSAPYGEWGYAALIEIGDTKILFDTGKHPDVIQHNLATLGLSLADVDTVVLSHRHSDHTGGLLALKAQYPAALNQLYVARGFVEKLAAKRDEGPLLTDAFTGTVHVIDAPTSLLGLPYVRLTGPIPRLLEERDVARERLAVPEDQALVIDTVDGLVVIVGCGHAGVVNTVDAAQAMFPGRPLHAVIGGLHLYERTPSYGFATLRAYLERIAERLRGLPYLLGSHCTGLEALYWLRARLANGDARRAIVDTPATRFVIGAAFYNEPVRRRAFLSEDPAKDPLVDGINPVNLNRPIDWPRPDK